MDEEVTSSVRKPVRSLKPAANLWPSVKSTTPCPPPKPVNRSRKENVTPMNNTNSVMETLERIRMSPKPLISYISRTPARDTSLIAPLRTPSLVSRMQAQNQIKKSTVTPKSEHRYEFLLIVIFPNVSFCRG